MSDKSPGRRVLKMMATNRAWKAALGTVCGAMLLFVSPCGRCEFQRAQRQVVARNAAINSPRMVRQEFLPGTDFQFVPKEKKRKVEHDTAYLRNGDKISGSVERISDGFVVVRSPLLAESARVPLKNVRTISLKNRGEVSPGRQAAAFFFNGDRLSVDLRGVEGGRVTLATDFAPQVVVRKDDLARIVFRREPAIVYEADFSDGDMCGFKSGMGSEWGVKQGALRALGNDGWDRGAYLKLRQEGHLRYTWKLAASAGSSPHSSLFFFAERPDPYQIGNAYQVLISGRGVNLYATVLNNSQHLASYMLSSDKASQNLELDYDSLTGEVSLKVDGQEVIAGEFTLPIGSGEYIVVSAPPRDGFDYIRVMRVADAVLPTAGEGEEGKDSVLLRNGDRLSGEVAQISEGKVRVKSSYSGEALDVPLDQISSFGFGRSAAKEAVQTPVVSFWNGDRLTGEVMRLDGNSLRLRSAYLGEIEVEASAVSDIVFEDGSGLSEATNEADKSERWPQLLHGEAAEQTASFVHQS